VIWYAVDRQRARPAFRGRALAGRRVAPIDLFLEEKSVFLREHDGQHAGGICRIGRILGAEPHLGVIRVDFPIAGL
jgi:hypothetical protein